MYVNRIVMAWRAAWRHDACGPPFGLLKCTLEEESAGATIGDGIEYFPDSNLRLLDVRGFWKTCELQDSALNSELSKPRAQTFEALKPSF